MSGAGKNRPRLMRRNLLIRCESLTKEYGEDGIFDLSFQVEKGQTLGILGPAGAGKSLTLRVLLGLIRADTGDAAMFGMNCWFQRHQIMKRAAYCPALPPLEPKRNGRGVYPLHRATTTGVSTRRKARKLTQRLDISLTGQCRGDERGIAQETRLAGSAFPGQGSDPAGMSR